MAFKVSRALTGAPEDPEALLRDLRPRKIPGPLAHQADLMRAYVKDAQNEPDVALQLPTGAGKTLVGLLIGEWRRRKNQERVVYLCPTNQLVNQVAAQATSMYGLRVLPFTGKKAYFSSEAKSEYTNAEAVAVTSYSSLFNVNPFFGDPQVIILDDAHSADNYIGDFWSVRVDRINANEAPLFDALASALKPVLSAVEYARLTSANRSSWDAHWIEKIPAPALNSLAPELTSIIDAHAANLDLRFAWGLLRDHLTACHLFLSSREMLLRPLIPPTRTHAPFANAKQRIYMSATLGAGGELERITGREAIKRLPVPAGWDQQGIGRRFFTFPLRPLGEDDTPAFIADAMRLAKRTLYLVPDDRSAQRVREWVAAEIPGIRIFSARELEESKAPFVSSELAVAVAANRYDGIDLPEDECRLLVIEGLPRATNLLERFLVERMGAQILLDDRILTRVVQGFGRCTRSATDSAAVIATGESLHTFLHQRDRRRFFHPEIQAELEFSIEQSRGATAGCLRDNLKAFLAQDNSWKDAEDVIVELRGRLKQASLPATAQLSAAVAEEVRFQYALWDGNFEKAVECGREVLGKLHDPALQGYRALWHYLTGSAAHFASQSGRTAMEAVAREQFNCAAKAASGIRWLHRLRLPEQPAEYELDTRLVTALVERLEEVFQRLGTVHDRRYSAEEAFILSNLAKNESGPFEEAHKRLGTMLGYEAGKEESSGSPDPWWMADPSFCIVFEDHSDAKDASSLDVKKARQATTHPNWIRERLSLAENAEVVAVLVTPVRRADVASIPHLKEVRHWSLDAFRNWARNALAAVRELRRTFSGPGDLVWRAEAISQLRQQSIDPLSLKALLKESSAQVLGRE